MIDNNLLIKIDSAPSINYANYKAEITNKILSSSNKQNSFSFLKKILITNNTNEDIYGAIIKISFIPDVIKIDDVPLTCLEKNKVTEINSFSIQIDPKFLYEISESIPGVLKVEILSKDNEILSIASTNIKILPIEEMASTNFSYEVLSSFVTPNDDLVKEVVNKASKIKEEKYDDSSFDGYQSHDPDMVMEQIDSIYLALQKEGIRYSNPPASFEKTFQRLRLPRTSLLEKCATCIDFTLLFASCLENIGLNPILIVVEGHAFLGIWLEDNMYQTGLNDNLSLLSNDSSETNTRIALVNPVDLAASSLTNFPSSQINAKTILNTEQFHFFIDVASSRNDGILPLPTPHEINGKTTIDFEVNVSSNYDLNKVSSKAGILEKGTGHKSKFDVWEDNLLDLNLGNNLINFKIGASSLQLGIHDCYSFFDLIKNDGKWNLFPTENGELIKDKRFIYYAFDNAYLTSFATSLNKKFIQVFSKNIKSEDAIKNISRKAYTQIEESGCNPLFLTLGVVNWFDNEVSSKNGKYGITSPLILIPASLPKRKSGPYYSLELDLDGIQFNTTLLEYFKQNFDLDFAEFDGIFESNSIDLRKIFNTFRQKISSKQNWTLDENISSLSLFSFAHFVMWSDMKRYQDIFLKNEVVKSFVQGKKLWKDKGGNISISRLDDLIKPNDLALPLSYDSSQLLAIKCSDEGQSFVLDGPPGTGKSQTIANIIVNALRENKKILFVAEKEVALQVVKKRLDDLNLGQFCLQIHSAKANKKEVLSQLGASLGIGKTAYPENKEEEASSLLKLRNELNDVLSRLHDKKGFFVSPYVAILNYLSYQRYKSFTYVSKEYAKEMNEDKYNKCLDSIDRIKLYALPLGGYFASPFIFFKSKQYSLSFRDEMFLEVEKILSLLNNARESFINLVNSIFLSIKLNEINYLSLAKCLELIKEKGVDIDYQKLINRTLYQQKDNVISYFSTLIAYKEKEEELFLLSIPSIYNLNEENLLSRLDKAKSLGFFSRYKEYRRIKKEVSLFIKDKSIIKKEISIRNFLQLVKETKEKKLAYESINRFASFSYKEEGTKSLNDIKKDFEICKNTISLLSNLENVSGGSSSSFSPLYSFFSSFGVNPSCLYEEYVASFISNFEELKSKNEDLKQKYEFDVFTPVESDVYFDSVLNSLHKAINDKERFGEWVKLLIAIDEASLYLPEGLLTNYKNGKIDENELEPCFNCALFYQIMVSSLFEEDLLSLNSNEIENKIVKYKEAIDEFKTLSIKETAYSITKNFPNENGHYANSSSIYQLKKLIATNGRGKSLRSIFDLYGQTIFNLTPCFLMSPLSLAQFIDPSKHHFDLVIFDEASQIPTSEAIGAIARGDSCIIAGDQQQMPPTNFFNATLSFSSTNDDAINYDDLESLLDDAITLGLPRHRLTYHYRSHHESLIAFSNNKFYENSLSTFPSPNNQISAVKLVYVNGNYEMGKGINKEEANAIVKEVIRRLKDKELVKHSIGVVTFNKKQQDLINDLLDNAFNKDSSLNRTPGGEEIFIKNLENVQGDERDCILFSICFGPNKKTNTMSLNFGPLSREKGERRLNVAVSRARDEMIVFSSCLPSAIKSNLCKNEGAEYLKAFLLYAEKGSSCLSNDYSWSIKGEKTSFSSYLALNLTKLGYKVDTNVGTSSFKVDLAIKDPLDPSRYALGILTDDDTYCSLPTCLDRNVIGPDMLISLHWKLIHVFSSEYIDHPNVVVDRIVKSLSEPIALPSKNKKAPSLVFTKASPSNPYPHKKEYPLVDYSMVNVNSSLSGIISSILSIEAPISDELLKKRLRNIYKIGRISPQKYQIILSRLKEIGATPIDFDNITYWWPSSLLSSSITSYRVGEDRSMVDIPYEELKVCIQDIVDLQGRLTIDDLCKEVLHLFGFEALTERSKKHIKQAILKLGLNLA
mgnify:FL=1